MSRAEQPGGNTGGEMGQILDHLLCASDPKIRKQDARDALNLHAELRAALAAEREKVERAEADLKSEAAAHVVTGQNLDDHAAMLNRIASTVSDYFEPCNEECVADGVDGLMDALTATKAKLAACEEEKQFGWDALEAATERNKWADDERCACILDHKDDVCLAHSPAVSRERAKLAAAVAALREIVAHEPDCLCTGKRCSAIARAAIAAAETEKGKP